MPRYKRRFRRPLSLVTKNKWRATLKKATLEWELQKCRSDVARLRAHARWVLVIDKEGNVLEVVKNKNFIVNVIAVVGPAVYKGHELPEALLLEVGVSRGRPYQAAEQKRGAHRQTIAARNKVSPLSFLQLARLWEPLLTYMEECVIEGRAKWKTKHYWTTRIKLKPRGDWYKLREYERGIYFTIASSDAVLLEAFLHRDVAGRRYLTEEKAVFVRSFLREYKDRYFTDKQLKRLPGVYAAVELWRNMTKRRWSPRYSHTILATFSPEMRDLFDQVARVHALKVGEYKPDPVLCANALKLEFPRHFGVRLDGEGKKHGKGCTTFEVFFSKQYRERHGI